jgi:PEGA domain-containing protein
VPNRGRTVVVRPPSSYGYYYPRGYYPYVYGAYPYGFGAFGLGYFYYNPYRWYPGYAPGFSTYSYYDGYRRPFSTFDIGELRLDVSPRHAQVYVDGYYSGVVDDYDGAFQALKLESGTYRIEITAPGFETLSFDVRIPAGQRIRYQGELRRLP